MASQRERPENEGTHHPSGTFGTTGHFPRIQKENLEDCKPKLFMEETRACF